MSPLLTCSRGCGFSGLCLGLGGGGYRGRGVDFWTLTHERLHRPPFGPGCEGGRQVRAARSTVTEKSNEKARGRMRPEAI